MSRDRRYYCVYIMGSLTGTLYIGFSGNLHKRVFQYKFHHFEGFTDKYDVTRLLYWESYDDVPKALARDATEKMESCKEDCLDYAQESALAGSCRRVVPVDGVC